MAKRGRPRKIKLDIEDQIEELIFKMYDVRMDKNGKLQFVRNAVPLSLEETAVMLWAQEGRKTKNPLSKMMILNIENGALQKAKTSLAKKNLRSLDDFYEPKHRASVNRGGSVDEA